MLGIVIYIAIGVSLFGIAALFFRALPRLRALSPDAQIPRLYWENKATAYASWANLRTRFIAYLERALHFWRIKTIRHDNRLSKWIESVKNRLRLVVAGSRVWVIDRAVSYKERRAKDRMTREVLTTGPSTPMVEEEPEDVLPVVNEQASSRPKARLAKSAVTVVSLSEAVEIKVPSRKTRRSATVLAADIIKPVAARIHMPAVLQRRKPSEISFAVLAEEKLKSKEQELLRAIQQTPKEPKLYRELGELYERMGNGVDAREVLAAALKLEQSLNKRAITQEEPHIVTVGTPLVRNRRRKAESDADRV